MRLRDSTFGKLLKPINQRQFGAIVERFNGDAYDKSFKSWDHLVTLIFAQLSQISSLRGLVTALNANALYYRLGIRKRARSTLSDANARRPVEVFAETLTMLASMANGQMRREGGEMVRLIEASPIPLGKLFKCAKWNGRIRGMKMHLVYDPNRHVPHSVEVTPANVNDVEIGRKMKIKAGVTYVFDKGYCRFDWWTKINNCKAFFVTRAKRNMRLRVTRRRHPRKVVGDGFRIIEDAEVVLASKGDSRLAIPLRRIRVRREKGGIITLITNDLEHTAVEIAALYKLRWQIELLFRWIKQHLNIRKFLGRNQNAIRLQILAAIIAYLLLRIAARANSITMLPLRFAELVSQFLFTSRSLAEIGRPPPRKPTRTGWPSSLGVCHG